MGREVYLAGTVISMLISLVLYLSGRREAGLFIGLWAPTILLLDERMADELDRSRGYRIVWQRRRGRTR